jgi:hypothetical protein
MKEGVSKIQKQKSIKEQNTKIIKKNRKQSKKKTFLLHAFMFPSPLHTVFQFTTHRADRRRVKQKDPLVSC